MSLVSSIIARTPEIRYLWLGGAIGPILEDVVWFLCFLVIWNCHCWRRIIFHLDHIHCSQQIRTTKAKYRKQQGRRHVCNDLKCCLLPVTRRTTCNNKNTDGVTTHRNCYTGLAGKFRNKAVSWCASLCVTRHRQLIDQQTKCDVANGKRLWRWGSVGSC